jgi:DTW domain-containing protein YfiP
MLSKVMLVEESAEPKARKMRCDYCRKKTRQYLCGPRPTSDTEWKLGVMCLDCHAKHERLTASTGRTEGRDNGGE